MSVVPRRLLLAAVVTSVLAAAVAAGATVAARPAAAAPAVAVTVSPCGGSAGTCAADPATIDGSWGALSGVGGIEVTWDAAGRPAAAPAPSSPVVVLACPGLLTTGCSWSWPAGLADDGTILNGTYTVTACGPGTTGADCTASSAGGTVVRLGVAPAPPSGLTASTSSSGTVRLGWKPDPAPDIAAYTLYRGSTAVSTCWEHGAGPAGSPSCTDPPAATDRPGGGTWSYSVVAVRYGATGGAYVGSAPSAAATAAVPTPPSTTTPTTPPPTTVTTSQPGLGSGSTTTTAPGGNGAGGGSGRGGAAGSGGSGTGGGGTGGSGTGGGGTGGSGTGGAGTGGSGTGGSGTGGAGASGLPPLASAATLPPIAGVAPPASPGSTAPDGAAAAAAPGSATSSASPTTTAPGYGVTLPYGGQPAKGGTISGRTVAAGPTETAPASSVRGVGLLAGALLALAFAALLWYLRSAARPRPAHQRP